jgi:hypothetical protein
LVPFWAGIYNKYKRIEKRKVKGKRKESVERISGAKIWAGDRWNMLAVPAERVP